MSHYPPELARDDRLLTADELRQKYTTPSNDERDGEHPRYSAWDWRQAVAQRITIRGYWDWVEAQIDEENP
jgi:hypothetical protein